MRFTRSQIILVPILLLIDILSVILSVYLSYNLRFFSFISAYFPVLKGLPDWTIYRNTVYFSIPLFVFVFFQNEFYRSFFVSLLDELVRVIKAVTVGIFFLVLATFFYRNVTFSRVTFVLFWLLLLLSVFSFRELFKIIAGTFLRSVFGRENMLIVGEDNKSLRTILKQHPNFKVYYSPFNDENNTAKIKDLIARRHVSQVLLVHNKWAENVLMGFYDWWKPRCAMWLPSSTARP